MPLTTAELNKYGLIQFPLVNGADVPVVNISGVAPGQMVLDGPTLANIFLGKISNWSDPAIKKLNPGLMLPNQAITVAYRSDGSGTTFIWTNYLAKVSGDWRERVGVAPAVDWPVGIGGKGNEGVAAAVLQTPGSIGYVEYAYAKQSGLKFTRMINDAGKTVGPNFVSFQAAVGAADWARAPNFNLMLTNAPGEGIWPIAGSTWAIMYKQPVNAADSNEALKFFKWVYANGKLTAQALDYVPLPDSVSQLVQESWKQIRGVNP
jgi:phosphate transport system substrate-binding protein